MESPIQRRIPPKLASALALAALLTVLAPSAPAQRSTHAARARFNLPTANHPFRQTAHPSAFRRSSPRTSLPFPFPGDFLTLDDLYSAGYPVSSQPPVFLLQAARALPGFKDSPAQPENEPTTKTQPLMIERQNGHYIRVTSTPANGEPLSLESDNKPAPSTATLPPALLVFRDGHTEEVRDYTIADGTIYARGNYYTDGYWNKKIAISTLNVPQTIEANARQSVKFVLPTSPNEVITRP